MKKILLNTSVLLVFAIVIAACNNDRTKKDTNDNLNETSDTSTRITDRMSNTDSNTSTNLGDTQTTTKNDFVTKAATGGMLEVEMGKLAQSNGGIESVKEYGRMLEKDHGAANAKLKDIAKAEKFMLPVAMTEEQKGHISHMQSLKGTAFGKDFVTMMVEDHKKDIAEFKKAAQSNDNKKIQEFAAATLPTLETHLKKAQSIKLR